MKLSQSVKLYLFICLLSIPPLIDLFLHPGFPHTSDGTMHLIRHAVYFKEFMSGQFPIRWASQFNYGYGTPIFNFFHPLPYLAGLPFQAMGMNVYQLLKLEYIVTYLLAGVGMAAFARAFFRDDRKAILAAVVYQYAPYRFVEMYIRGDLGGLYAFAILPFLFLGIILIISRKTLWPAVVTALLSALLSMSHNIVGFVFFGLSFTFGLLYPKTLKEKAVVAASHFAGLAVAAFFIVPAIIEHRYTYGYLLTKNLFYGHFAPWYLFFIPNLTNSPALRTAELTVQIGAVQTLALIAAVYALLKRTTKGSERFIFAFSVSVFVLTFLFMQPVTRGLWENIPFLRQFQFPWRLLAIVNFLTAIASVSFMSLKILKNKLVYWGIIGVSILTTVFYWQPYQGYVAFPLSYFDTYPLSTNYFGEVNSIWMAGEPTEFPKRRIEVIAGQARVTDVSLEMRDHTFTVTASQSATILDRTQFYPGWKAYVDGISQAIQFQDQNYRGLITFAVPAGWHRVEVVYSEDKLQKLSDAVSVGSLVLLIGSWAIFGRRKII